MKRGRKGKYETDIKPRFDEITHWLRSGASEKQICENLGITKDTFYRYKRNYKAHVTAQGSILIQSSGRCSNRVLSVTPGIARSSITGFHSEQISQSIGCSVSSTAETSLRLKKSSNVSFRLKQSRHIFL